MKLISPLLRLLLLAGLTLLPGAAKADSLEVLASAGGDFTCVAVQGDYAYIGEGRHVSVFDVSDESNLRPVGRLRLDGPVKEIAVSGNLVTAIVNGDLRLVNVTNPVAPVRRGDFTTPGDAQEVTIHEGLAYIADGLAGLVVADTADPDGPVQRAISNTPGFAYGVTIAGNYAYVSDGDYGLRIFDISSAPSLVVRGVLDPGGTARRCLVQGNYAFLRTDVLRVINVSNPSNPLLRAGLLLNSSAAFAISGTRLFSGGNLIDIGKPTAPVIVAQNYNGGVDASEQNSIFYSVGASGLSVLGINNFPTGAVISSSPATRVAVSGKLAGAIYGTRIQFTDVSDPLHSDHLSTYTLNAEGKDLFISGSTAYVLTSQLTSLDVSNPESPTPLGAYFSGGYRMAVSGNVAYILSDNEIRAVGLSNPSNLTLLGKYTIPASETGYPTFEIAAFGTTVCYAGEYVNSVWLIDFSNPANPIRRGRIETINPGDVAFADATTICITKYAYPGFYLFDISNLDIPVFIATGQISALRSGLAISGKYAAVRSGYSIGFVDISERENPQPLGFYFIGENYDQPVDLAPSEDGFYMAGAVSGLRYLRPPDAPAQHSSLVELDELIIDEAQSNLFASRITSQTTSSLVVADISNPAFPRITKLVSGASLDAGPTNAFAAGKLYNYASGSLTVYESLESSVNEIGKYRTPSSARGVAVAGNTAFLRRTDAIVELLDVANPAAISRRSLAFPSGAPVDMAASGPVAYIAEVLDGFEILDAGDPDSPALVGSIPGTTSRIFVEGDYLAAAHQNALQLYDITNPKAPAARSTMVASGTLQDVSIAGDRMWLATSSGVQVYDISGPGAPTSVAALSQFGPMTTVDAIGSGDQAYVAGDELFLLHLADENPVASRPVGLRAVPGADSIQLTWAPNPEPYVTGYHVYRALRSSDPYDRLTTATVALPEYLDAGLTPDTRYFYRVTAVSSGGESLPSNPASTAPGEIVPLLSSVHAPPGAEAAIQVSLRNGRGVIGAGVSVRFTYDTRWLTPNRVESSYLMRDFDVAANFSNPGEVWITAVNDSPIEITGNGHLFDVVFVVHPETPANATGQFVFTFVEFVRADGTPIGVNLQDADTGEFRARPDYGRGDLNGDGQVTAADVLISAQISTGKRVPDALAALAGELTGEEEINTADSTLVARLAVGLPLNPDAASLSAAKAGPSGYTAALDGGAAYLVEEGASRTLYVPLRIEGTGRLAGVEAVVGADPSVLTPRGVLRGGLTANRGGELDFRITDDGASRVSLGMPNNASALSGTALRFVFDVSDQATTARLKLAELRLTGPYGENLAWDNAVSSFDGEIDLAAIQAASRIRDVLLGFASGAPADDLNGDGQTDIADLLTIFIP